MPARAAGYRAARGTPSPRTALTYAFLSSNCSAARAVTSERGPANTVTPIVRLTRKAIGATMDTPRRGWEPDDEAGTAAGFQNDSSQSRAIDNTVNKLTDKATAASTYRPVPIIGATTATFAMNPERGGMPASENSGTSARHATAG